MRPMTRSKTRLFAGGVGFLRDNRCGACMDNVNGYAGPYLLPSLCIIPCAEREARSVPSPGPGIAPSEVVGSPEGHVGVEFV
jgi:hypothetical protein